MQVQRLKALPHIAAHKNGEHHKLVVEFAIAGGPTETIDVKIVKDGIQLFAKPHKAEALYMDGLLRIEVPFKDRLEDAVKVAIKRIACRRRPRLLYSA
jgi:HSP20 family molecular chaperone IbpA